MQHVAIQKVLDTEDVVVAVGPFDSWEAVALQAPEAQQILMLLAPPEMKASDAENV